ncbi:MAG TPA: glycoside hydrolase family 66 protein [Symbiobacteriaceae bacterium]
MSIIGWELAIWPDRAQYRPGAAVTLIAEVHGPAGAEAALLVEVTERAATVGELVAAITLDGAGSARVLLAWQPPEGIAWRAYGADATLTAGSNPVAKATTALDVAPHWGNAPRNGFLANFAPGQTESDDAARADAMLRLHLNCIQFYDWMYTHYDYIPPQDLFTDPLGAHMDFGAVRRRIQLCRERGMAPLAYASVYGAEKEFSDAHPDWLLYDGTGRPMNPLCGLFYFQDPSPDGGWRQYLLGSYQQALDLGFAGTHCDTYGSPKAGLTQDGRLVRLEQVLPGLVADAHALAVAADPVEGGSTFNNVKGWPVEAMSTAPAAALYIEVWPPDEMYRDLYELVLRARYLDRKRQLIISAYLWPFTPKQDRPAGAMAGLRLAAATVFASGGFYLLLGEGTAVLNEAYYKDHGYLDQDDWETVRAYWDFQTRYGPLLADPAALDVTTANTCFGAVEARFTGPEGLTFSAKALPGTVWHIVKDGPGYRTYNLINLTAVEKPLWNSAQPEARPVQGIGVRLECLRRPKAVWWASPDVDGGQPQPAAWSLEKDDAIGQVLVTTVPHLHYWSMLVVED